MNASKETTRPSGPVRVLHIIQNLHYGGMERLLADIVRNIDRSRFESHVVTLQYIGPLGKGLESVARIEKATPQPWYSMVWPETLARQIRAIGPHVVHTHSGVWYKASLAARRAGVPRIIHTDHGRAKPDPALDRMFESLASRWTDVVVAVSDALATYLSARRIAPARKIRIVRNGVDTEYYCPGGGDGAIRRELEIPDDAPIIGCVGRLEQIKGPDVLVEALRVLRDRWTEGTHPVLVLIGDGSLRPQLMEFLERHDLTKWARLVGWREDILDLLRAFTVFTMGSRSEGTSVSLLEAMSTGLCPIVTDVGGNAAILGDELRAGLVPPENPTALAEAWMHVLAQPDRVVAAADLARRRVTGEFDLKRMVGDYEKLYTGDDHDAG